MTAPEPGFSEPIFQPASPATAAADNTDFTSDGAQMTTIPTPILNVRDIPARHVNYCVQRRRERPIKILRQPATRYMRHRVNPIENGLERRQIRPVLGQKNIRDRPSTAGKRITHSQLQSFGNDLSRERVSVRVQSRAWKTNQDIVGLHTVRPENAILFHISDDEPRQVVIRRRVQTRHFGGFPAY